ncbi:MAG: VOC family protein [Proteobacteria bacterium]|nr:VOC family protein [Pseudomonadota bacterium]HQR02781.1 VOC family protein [Rhodocyclaceae bacterium]
MELKKSAIDIVLVTRRQADMVAFYRDRLGFPVQGEVDIPDIARIVRMACGQSLIRLVAPAGTAALPPALPGPILAALGLRAMSIQVADLQSDLTGWKSAGVTVQQDYTDLRPGVAVAVIEDPDGNAIEVMCQQP